MRGSNLFGDDSMRYEIKYSPSYSMLVVDLKAGEKVTGEAGALTYMTPNMDIKT